jgi:hypothetical protein
MSTQHCPHNQPRAVLKRAVFPKWTRVVGLQIGGREVWLLGAVLEVRTVMGTLKDCTKLQHLQHDRRYCNVPGDCLRKANPLHPPWSHRRCTVLVFEQNLALEVLLDHTIAGDAGNVHAFQSHASRVSLL